MAKHWTFLPRELDTFIKDCCPDHDEILAGILPLMLQTDEYTENSMYP